MSNTNSRATMKWWDTHTKKLKYCSSAIFDEHNNRFSKLWSLGYGIIIGKHISTVPTLKLISHIFPSQNMIYLKYMLISHQGVLLLMSLQNTVNIITYIYLTVNKQYHMESCLSINKQD